MQLLLICMRIDCLLSRPPLLIMKFIVSSSCIFILLCIALPILNISYLLKNNYIQNFSGYWDFARIDIFFWLFAALAFFIFLKIKPIQNKASDKIQKKLSKLNIEVNS